MRLWVKVLLLMFAVYSGGVVTGLFVSPSYYEQTKIIGQAATVIQYPAIIGVVIAAWKVISDLYRENVLKYGGIHVKQQHYNEGGKDILRPAYYLRVKRVRGREGLKTVMVFLQLKEPRLTVTQYGTETFPICQLALRET